MTKRTFPASAARLLWGLAGAAAAAACGGDAPPSDPDAHRASDGALPDALPPPCDHQEADDLGNGTPADGEATGLTVGADGVRICGQLDVRAPATSGLVDADAYRVTIANPGSYLVRIAADVGTTLPFVDSFTQLASGGPTALRGSGIHVGGHLVYALELEAGEQTVVVRGFHEREPDAPVPYRIRILPDDPQTRCAHLAGTPTYREAGDGAGNTGNDVVQVVWAPQLATTLTPSTSDAPEPSASALAITAGMSYRADGVLNTPNGGGIDEYLDRDTYLIATGANTRELSIRVNWAGDDADLDLLLFPVPSGTRPPVVLAESATIRTRGPEFLTHAVLPSTTYWLWIGNYAGSAEPTAYDVTLCGHGGPL
jgi:hypothetical protein